jgi:hypothetical protein
LQANRLVLLAKTGEDGKGTFFLRVVLRAFEQKGGTSMLLKITDREET